jgi:CRP-like cAMP-binding protein
MLAHGQIINPTQNGLLAALRPDEYERLRRHFEPIHLPQGKVIYEASGAVRHVYFLTGGVASLLSTTADGSTVEVAMIGSEGFLGIPAVLQADVSPYRIIVQVRGGGVRLRAGLLRDEFDRCGHFQRLLLRYTHALLTHVSQSAVCNRFHTVEERLCRWLLVTRDCVCSDSFDLTQEFLSYMLGVPRTSVTAVAGALQRAGLIRYRRGRITITNGAGLGATSCECYWVIRDEMSRHLAA